MTTYEVIAKFRTLRKVFGQRWMIIADGKKWADPFCEVFDTMVETERARQDDYFERKSLDQLVEFWKDLVKWFGPDQRLELDGWDFEEMALKHGLIRKEEYDRERHGSIDAEEGDIIWLNNLEIENEKTPNSNQDNK